MDTVVIGASGGIGAALAERYEAQGDRVHRLSRSGGGIDLADAASIAAAAQAAAVRERRSGWWSRRACCTSEALAPERSLRDLDAERLERAVSSSMRSARH